MISFPCTVCRSPLEAEDEQAGKLVRCPGCRAAVRVPTEPAAAPVMVAGPSSRSTTTVGSRSAPAQRQAPPPPPPSAIPPTPRSGGKRYGFHCPYCSSRLEANESQAAQEGGCPTCGNTITIPILDRYNRLIDPKTRQIIKQDPHPVHAYAAAGDRAPKIVRREKDQQFIICPRCSAQSPISANNCKSCGMPFTMEGTTVESAGSSNGFAVASLVMGIIGIPAACAVFPPALAIIFGIIGFNQILRGGEGAGGKGMAIAGIVLGVIGAAMAFGWHWNLW
jgi:ribosomal protein L40E/DNA-directed RNA polymerase subunit RPC12/RpoP